MKIAIVGSGIAGNTAAYLLRAEHEITVFESAPYVGGHTNTVSVESSIGTLAVDTGFIVFNDRTYPRFNRLLTEIGQDWQPSVMSFSVQSADGGLEYNGASLGSLFAQRRNLLRPSFWRMLRDILRFNREAVEFLSFGNPEETVGAYLAGNGYSAEFTDHYLVPMAAAIWSAEQASVLGMPMLFLARFFQNHGLLQIKDRPQWRVIKGGSRAYVERLTSAHADRIRLNCAVRGITRRADGVYIRSEASAVERFDAVFLACHSDQALALLSDADELEREVLGAMPYQRNEAVLHTDTRLMPSRKSCWAAWNYHLPSEPGGLAAVTYNMNILQGLPAPEQYLVSLNSDQYIDEQRVLRRIEYEHPVFSLRSHAAQSRHAELNANGQTLFCGAYWCNGFHEDGVESAIAAVRHFEEACANGQRHFRRTG